MKRLIIIISILFISSCGYHLRQSGEISTVYPNVYLDISNQSLLKVSLSNILISSGVNIVDINHVDKNILKIHKDSLIKHIQSIGANNRVQEYRLEYDVEYSLSEGKVNSIHLEKDYSFDDQQIAGSQQEELNLRKQLAEDMGWAIVRQINLTIK